MTHSILVVDDEPDVEMLIALKFRRGIAQGDYVFTFASNGTEAYEKVTASPDIDVVLTDINMPEMDGLALLGKLNDLEYPPKTVVVSAYSDMNNIRAAMNKGAFDFVTKPINSKDLLITLERTLRAIDEEKANRIRLKQAQLQLVQSEKMSSLGQMLAGVAHEINNPVNYVYGNLNPARSYVEELIELIELYQQHYPNPNPDIQNYIEEIDLDFLQEDLAKLMDSLEMGATRIRELVLSLRNFSRLDEFEKEAVDVHVGIESTLVILNSRLKGTADTSQIKVIRKYDVLPKVPCHASQLNQVIMNIVGNAIDAFEECAEGRCAKQVAEQLADEKHLKVITISTEAVGEWVRIAIADNGPGMTQETIDKLFDPFFTTKPLGKGTGLGLAISHQIVTEKHGGRLSCVSTAGEGSEFVIELPL
ncbi:MAG: ATP-binding protein [Cyanobacteria bacterium J06554_11]